jgi:pimeloyl-[acyl-carrier protein] synthase
MMTQQVPFWNPFREGYLENPSEQLRVLREVNPVHKAVNGRWIVLRYDDVKTLLTNPAFQTVKFSAGLASKAKFLEGGEDFDAIAAVAAKWFLFFDPPQHTEIRGWVSKIWNQYDVCADIESITNDSLELIHNKDRVEIIRDFAVFVPARVVCRILGLPPADHEKFKPWAYAFNSVFEPFATLHDIKKYNKSAEEFIQYMDRVIEEKLSRPDDRFISRVLAENEKSDKPLNRSELISLISFMFFAGIETSVNLFGQAVLYLLKTPSQAKLLREDPKIVPTAVEELLRFISPNQYTLRVAARDVEMRGQLIPKGDFVMASTVSANRDPLIFEDPERLILGRTKNPHLGFGFGLHYCMGARLARDEIGISLPALFKRFPNLRLDDARPHEWDKIILNRGLKSLPIRID